MHYNTTGNSWMTGDFTFDGIVNADDLDVLVRNWQVGVAPLQSMPLGTALDAAFSQVPEPTTPIIICLWLLWAAGSRRRVARN
jgi:hypothetical protein